MGKLLPLGIKYQPLSSEGVEQLCIQHEEEIAKLRELIESVYDLPYTCHGCVEILSNVSELVNHDCPGE